MEYPALQTLATLDSPNSQFCLFNSEGPLVSAWVAPLCTGSTLSLGSKLGQQFVSLFLRDYVALAVVQCLKTIGFPLFLNFV